MNKSDLIIAFAEDQNFSPKTASKIVGTILDSMSKALINGENIEIRGFGSFTIREYGSYAGFNPKTRQQINTKPKKLPFFKPGKDFKFAVNENRKK